LTLAVYAPAQRLVRQVVLAEDAYVGERMLLDQLQLRAGEVWIADRNFCVRSFLFRLHRAQSTFVVRWHASGGTAGTANRAWADAVAELSYHAVVMEIHSSLHAW
jgi:hypothetical protein